MKKISVIFCLFLALTAMAFADSHVVQTGDTLSEIVKSRFPGQTLYGPTGTLKRIIDLNPHIKNPNFIKPKVAVYFAPITTPEDIETSITVIPEPSDDPVLGNDEIASPDLFPQADVDKLVVDEEAVPLDESTSVAGTSSRGPKLELAVAPFFGARFMAINQSGALGGAKGSNLFMNDLGLVGNYEKGDWKSSLNFNTFRFKDDDSVNGRATTLSSLDGFLSHKGWVGNLGYEQNPLFNNEVSGLERSKQTLLYAGLGYEKTISFEAMSPTDLMLRGLVRLPVSDLSLTSKFDSSSLRGYALKAQAEWSREFFSKDSYNLSVVWLNDLQYQDLSQRVHWGETAGRVKSQYTTFTSSLGLRLTY